jgi:hypothetical protein
MEEVPMLKQALTLFACLFLSTALEAQIVDQVERGIYGDAIQYAGPFPSCWEEDEVISDQPGQFSEGLDVKASTATQVSVVGNEFSGALTAIAALQPGGANQDAFVGTWVEVTFTLTEATEATVELDGSWDATLFGSFGCSNAGASLTIIETLLATDLYTFDATASGVFTDATTLMLEAGTYQLSVAIFASSSASGIACAGTAESSLNFSMSLLGSGETFRRGDANLDGAHNIADAIFNVNALLFSGSPQPSCSDSADANDDGVLDIADVIFSLNSLFVPTSPAPAYPGPDTCGLDAMLDTLDCRSGCP